MLKNEDIIECIVRTHDILYQDPKFQPRLGTRIFDLSFPVILKHLLEEKEKANERGKSLLTG